MLSLLAIAAIFNPSATAQIPPYGGHSPHEQKFVEAANGVRLEVPDRDGFGHPRMVISDEELPSMFTYKFVGLLPADATTPYYYGSLPAKPEKGQTILIHETGNRYRVTGVDGEGLKGKGGTPDQQELAWAEIGGGKKVPTLHLSPIAKPKKVKLRTFVAGKAVKWHADKSAKPPEPRPLTARGKAVDADDFKQQSRLNRKRRLKKPSQ